MKIATWPQKISFEFNNYFVNIRPSLLKSIPETSFHFKDSLQEKTVDSFFLKYIDEKITRLIFQLNN